ncbi:thymidine kinase [Clostridium disporicum]|uniref:thymidine kinase n=1 Tax=Clostridium disporicum TaxID=84024 RepID=UPI0034A26E15
MAKLYLRYATMESGKSAEILQVNYNYNKVGMNGILLIPQIDTTSNGTISSRLGISSPALPIKKTDNLYELIKERHDKEKLSYIILDESNFISREQADQLSDVVDFLDIDVLAYGLLTDFKTALFEGTARLIELQDELAEISVKSICHCGEKANFNARIVNGEIVKEGEQIVLDLKDGKEHEVKYVPLCRKCFKLNKWKLDK